MDLWMCLVSSPLITIHVCGVGLESGLTMKIFGVCSRWGGNTIIGRLDTISEEGKEDVLCGEIQTGLSLFKHGS